MTLYSACLPVWLNMRVTSEKHVPQVAKTRNALRNILVSLATSFVARYKVSHVAKLGDTHHNVVRDMSPSLAGP